MANGNEDPYAHLGRGAEDPYARFGRGPQERPNVLKDVAKQGARGVAEGFLAFDAGVTDLLGFDKTADEIRRSRDRLRERLGRGETLPGKAAGVVGRGLSEAGLFLLPGGIAGKAAPKFLKGAPLLRSLLLGAPIDAAVEAGERPEESLVGAIGELTGSEKLKDISESTAGRSLGGVAVGAGLGTILDAGLRGARRLKRGAPTPKVDVPTDPYAHLGVKPGEVEALEGAALAEHRLAQRRQFPPETTADERAALDIQRFVESERAAGRPIDPDAIGERFLERRAADRRGGQAVGDVGEAVTPPPAPRTRTLVEDVPPALENDFKASVDALARSEEAIPETIEAVAKAKESGAIPENVPTTIAELDEAAKGIDLDALIGKGRKGPLDATQTRALKGEFNSVTRELGAEYEKLARAAEGSEEAFAINQRIEELTSRQGAVLGEYFPGGSENARALAARRADYLVNDDPAHWFTVAKRELGRDLTEVEQAELTRALGTGDSEAIAKLIGSYRDPVTFGKEPGEFLVTLRKSGLISAAVSLGRALVGNSSRVATDVAAKPAAVMLDTVLSMLTKGSRTVAPMAPARSTRQTLRGLIEGVSQSGGIMRGQHMEEIAQKLEIPKHRRLRSPFAIGRERGPGGEVTKEGFDLVDQWAQFWFRIQGAADRPFSRVAYHRSLGEQATLRAREAGLRGSKAADEIQRLVDNPTAEMSMRAQVESSVATFQNNTVLHNLVSGAKTGARKGVKIGSKRISTPTLATAVEIVQPFSRTPSSVVSQGLETTPLGAFASINDFAKLWKAVHAEAPDRALIQELQRRAAKRGARWMTVGAAGTLLGAKLYSDGKMTGAAPRGGSARTQFFNEGKMPFSIHGSTISGIPGIKDNRWYSLAQLQPFGASIAFGASMAETIDQAEGTPSLGEFVAAGGEAGMRQALETPFLRGSKEIVEAMEGSRGLGEFASGVAGSFVPSLVSRTAMGIDPVLREPEGILETIQSRIPGASRALPAGVDVITGEDRVREPEGGDKWFHAMFDVLGSRRDRTLDNVVIAEMEKVGASIGRVNQDKDSTEEEYREKQRLYYRTTYRVMTEFLTSDDVPDSLSRVGVKPQLFADYKNLGQMDPDREIGVVRSSGDVERMTARERQGEILNLLVSRTRAAITKALKE